MKKTILVAGSKQLKDFHELKRSFAQGIGAAIVKEPDWRLLTGGAKGAGENDLSGGIDFHAALGAQQALNDPVIEKEKIITLHPRDNRNDLFHIGQVYFGRAKSTPARRFEMVSRADAVIVIAGEEGSGQIIEYSIASNKVVIPLACFGGASREAWQEKKLRKELLNSLKLEEGSPEIEKIEKGDNLDELIKLCINILRKLLKPTCLVIMPFTAWHSDSLWGTLEPVIESSGFLPLRADWSLDLKQIIDDVILLLKEAGIVIADISGANPNVMYELGYSHAIGKPTVIVCAVGEKENIEDKLPFDIRGMRITPFTPGRTKDFIQKLKTLLGEYQEHK